MKIRKPTPAGVVLAGVVLVLSLVIVQFIALGSPADAGRRGREFPIPTHSWHYHPARWDLSAYWRQVES